MVAQLTDEQLLLAQLCREPHEATWLEFKENFSDVEKIGEYISALANSAVLEGRAHAYFVWGVQDGTHAIVGTSVNPRLLKKGGEDFEPWLLRNIDPQVEVNFIHVDTGGASVWIAEIAAARDRPIAFKGREFIRIGSHKKSLRDFPDHQRRLWKAFEQEVFEQGIALDNQRDDDVLRLLDYPAYFDLLQAPLPAGKGPIIQYLMTDKLVVRSKVGLGITNLGAVLFARNLTDFPSLARKQVRVIQYVGANRLSTVHEQIGQRGYAAGFEGLITYVNGLLPRNEVIGEALRQDRPTFPVLAVRELLANMLIHQDFSLGGTGPMVEIFDDRLEVTNPGVPVIDVLRFVDLPPRSRNEALAGLMRRARICEERGSGWDKIALEAERNQMPAPYVEVSESHTRAVLSAPRPLTKMAKDDRIRAVYLHACLRSVASESTTNASVRERFGIEPKNTAAASRLLNEAMEANLIGLEDPTVGFKSRRYQPYWRLER